MELSLQRIRPSLLSELFINVLAFPDTILVFDEAKVYDLEGSVVQLSTASA
jgi:hypothetical protein